MDLKFRFLCQNTETYTKFQSQRRDTKFQTLGLPTQVSTPNGENGRGETFFSFFFNIFLS
jgi:hypothetical protein